MKKLKRKLGLSSVIAISIAGMLGGIFVLPGIAAAKTGSSIWLAFLLAAICILPAVLSKSELATAMPKSGGTYVYIERAFGPLFGTISGLGLWISLLLKSAFCLVGFGAYLLVFTNTTIPIKYLSVIFLFLIMILNIFGVKKVGKVQLFVVVVSILGLISLLFLGFPQIKKEYVNPFIKYGKEGLIASVAFVYIAYAGVTKVAAIAGEVKNPNRNLPLSMIFSLVLITIIYTAISYVLVGNVSLEILKDDYKPIYTLATNISGDGFAFTIAIIGVLTLISMANSGVLASSRFPFAMANDKLLPNLFTKVHNKYLTPTNTILFTCITMALVILFLDIEKIAKLASAFKVTMFITVNLCVIILRETSVQWYNPSYKSPLYPYVQLFGIISGFILLFYLGTMPILVLISIAILGGLLYLFYGKKTSRSGVLVNYGHIPALSILFKGKEKTNDISKITPVNEVESEYFTEKSSVIVTLLGNEYSPENLTEIGISLSSDKKIKVINITEAPDQTSLDAFNTKTAKIKSIERQINYVGKIQNININFDPLITHNISESIQSMSRSSYLKWLVLEWNGRAYNGLLINNPLGWILSNVNSNFALFKDNGIRYFSEIILAIRPNSKDLNKLIKTTAQIANFYKANFTLLHIVSENTSEDKFLKLKQSSEKHINEYSAFSKVRIERSDSPFDCVEEISSEYDLLVLGTPRKDTWKSVLFGTGKDLFATQANCSVLRLTIK